MKGIKLRFDYYMIVALLGFFATTPVITIPLGGRDLAVFRVFFYLILFIMAIKALQGRRIVIGRNSIILDYWLIEAVIACGLGGVILSAAAPQFNVPVTSNIIKTVAFLMFAILWGNQEAGSLQKANTALFKGLLYGCMANLIWASIDGIGYYTLGFSLNNRVFAQYIARHHIRYNMLSLITRGGLFRASGFNSDPAQVGFIAPLITCYACYEKKWWMLIFVVIGIISSASTTALVTAVAIFFFWLLSDHSGVNKVTSRNILISIIAIVVIAVALNMFGDELGFFVNSAISRIIKRLNRLYVQTDASTNIRWQYIVFFPRAVFNLGLNSIFGLGFGTASYSYVTDDMILNSIGHQNYFAYDPENTYISYFLDTGIIGFALFGLYMTKLTSFFKRKVKTQSTGFYLIGYAGVLATLLSMLFYHYILFTPQVLIAIAGLSEMDLRSREKTMVLSSRN